MTSSTDPALRVQSLSVSFVESDGSLDVLDEISFDLQSSSFVSVIGPSGSGKSTLLRVIIGLVPPSQGQVIFHKTTGGSEMPKIGMVFQKANLMPWRNVLENIALPLELAGLSKQEVVQQATQMVEMVGLLGFEKSYPHELSGGMAQRVAIARALVPDPDILLLDEPFGQLDALTRERMGEELLRIWQTKQKTVLMVTHSIPEAIYLSDRILVLTSRPARICLDLAVNLPRPRQEDMRYSQPFVELAQQIRHQLSSMAG